MAKITNKAQLNVGVELTLDTALSTFTLNVAGNLVAKDGVTIQALYSKFIDLWTTSAYFFLVSMLSLYSGKTSLNKSEFI